MRRVAALCVRADSIYRRLRAVDCFDAQREHTPEPMARWLLQVARAVG